LLDKQIRFAINLIVETLYSVEVFFKSNWQVISSTLVESTAENLRTYWIKQGLGEDDIRITKSDFKFDKKWQSD
jgi:hypothetical protein